MKGHSRLLSRTWMFLAVGVVALIAHPVVLYYLWSHVTLSAAVVSGVIHHQRHGQADRARVVRANAERLCAQRARCRNGGGDADQDPDGRESRAVADGHQQRPAN